MGWIVARFAGVAFMVCLLMTVASTVFAGAGDPPNFVPELRFSYADPESGQRVTCEEDCRRFTVPSGVVLEVQVLVLNNGGSAGGDGVTWDLWFNQPFHPFPGLDIAACYDEKPAQFDRGCWQDMIERADLNTWGDLIADRVCIPIDPGDCRDDIVRVTMDPDFEGARKRGVYHFGVWADRFRSAPEWDEFDNYAGPVRVTVERRHRVAGESSVAPLKPVSTTQLAQEPAMAGATTSSVMVPSSPKPYSVVVVPEEVEKAFSLTSVRSRGLLEFSPNSAGRVTVEVFQTGMYENMVVQIRKVSTGEVLAEAEGKGRLQLEGGVDNLHLKDDRLFEVKVIPGQGSRGARGTIRVSYPGKIRFMVDQ